MQKKKTKKQTKSVELKEWWFKPKIQEHDILNKLKNVKKHLEKGGKAKVTVKYVSRANFDDMKATLKRIVDLAQEFSEPMSEINKEGRNFSIFLKSKKQKRKINEEESQNTQVNS